MEELLKNISADDIEKLKMLLSIIPTNEPKEVVTMRVFIEEYKNLIQHNRSSSYLRSVVISLNYLVDYFFITYHKPGLQKLIVSITQKDIENFLIHLQQKVKKGYVVYYRNLKAAFNKAKDWGYIKENYFTKVRLPKRQKLAPMFVNSDQLSAISGHIKNEVVKNVIVFAFYTGMRLDEIVNLRWKNIDLENKVITVGDENFTTKGRKQRFIPICDEALTAVISRRSGQAQRERKNFTINVLPFDCHFDKLSASSQGFVFCKSDGSKFTGNYFSRRFKKACIAAGLDSKINFHSLRHSFASNLAQKDVPLYTIKELLGHSSISTTEIYSHLNMESLRKAIKKLDETPSCVLPLSKGEKSGPQIFRINSGEK